ncbi:MAG: hypothetical protein WKF66_09455 [Pedobacter sp.]
MTRDIKWLLLIFLLVCSCKPAINEEQIGQANYFDIKGYFETEIARLSKVKPRIIKSVEVNGVLEKKTVLVTNWKQELSIFSDAEINRVSWKGLFTVSKNDTKQTYLSNNEKVPVKAIEVSLSNGKVNKILIVIRNANLLYTSVDSLIYVPNRSYLIKKRQSIRFFSDKNFLVEGKFR